MRLYSPLLYAPIFVLWYRNFNFSPDTGLISLSFILPEVWTTAFLLNRIKLKKNTAIVKGDNEIEILLRVKTRML